MTPEERALDVVEKTAYAVTDYNHAGFTITIAYAIRSAVLEERKKIADFIKNDFIDYADDQHPDVVCDLIASAIQRGQHDRNDTTKPASIRDDASRGRPCDRLD